VPVQRCALTLPIPLLPLWTVQPVQSLSACTTGHFTFTYTSTHPIGRTACTEPQCLYNGALYLYVYIYSPYWPNGLYRASVPVQLGTLPLPIPRLPLWTVQNLQCLSACTTVHFIFTYTCTPPIALQPVQIISAFTTVLFIFSYICPPLLALGPVQSLIVGTKMHFNFTYTSTPLLAVKPVQNLSAYTRVHFNVTYTTTPLMDRKACTYR